MKIFSAFLATAATIFLNCQAQITEVNDMKEIIKYYKDADQNTLALFDVDMVLIQPEDPAFQWANMKRHSTIAKKIYKQVAPEKQSIFFHLMGTSCASMLIDPQSIELLHSLNEKNVPKMGLTACFTGKFAHIEDMEKWRIEELRKFGIDFSKDAVHPHRVVLSQLPAYRGNYATYANGILFANNLSKGDVLVAFLNAANHKPKKVIFIDDREGHLKEVEASLQQLDPSIEYQGIWYKGASDYPSKEISEKDFEVRWLAVAKQAESTE